MWYSLVTTEGKTYQLVLDLAIGNGHHILQGCIHVLVHWRWQRTSCLAEDENIHTFSPIKKHQHKNGSLAGFCFESLITEWLGQFLSTVSKKLEFKPDSDFTIKTNSHL